MNDDQSMHDRATGEHGPGGQAAEDSQSDGSPAAPRSALANDGSAASAGSGQEREDRDPPGEDGERQPQAGQGESEPGPDDQKAAGKRRRSFFREVPVLIVVALVIALVIKSFVVQAFYIPSSSMEDTLLPGDKVLVSKVVYHLRSIQAGDIVVFDGAGSWDQVPRSAAPSSNPIDRAYRATLLPLFRSIGGLFGTAPGQTDYIKRVIGVPGDHVACCNSAGLVTVNGVALHERSYLYPGTPPSEIHFSILVPPGRLWVMGDYRLVSDDSRLHTSDPGTGTIPENKVIGRAFMIVWPPDRWRVLQIPVTFGQPGITQAAAAVGAVGARAGAAAPYLPLAGGLAVAFPVTWLQRRVRTRPRLRRRARGSSISWRGILRRRAPRYR